MAQSRSPSEVFLALVNGVAEGRWEELPSLHAEQTPDAVRCWLPLGSPAVRAARTMALERPFPDQWCEP
jgi:uncharacterized protein